MKLLLLGYSDIAQRRVLPAARSIGLDRLDLACRSGLGERVTPAGMERLFDDYETALRHSDAELVYISTTNDRHADLARLALSVGKHVIVDKPAALRRDDVLALAEQAEVAGLCLAEANVWGSHPQVHHIASIFAEADSEPRQLLVSFSFPPLAPSNIRYRSDLGGGALADLGPYAVSPGRVFFGCEPSEVHAAIVAEDRGVDTAFCVQLVYPAGRCLVGQFGFTTGYSNRIELLGPDVRVQVERVFSPPPTYESECIVDVRGERRLHVQAPANTFALFLGDVLAAISTGESARLREAMILDHCTLARVRTAAGRPA